MKTLASIAEFISDNSLLSTLLAALICTALAWLLRSQRNKKDAEKIYAFLAQTAEDGKYTFRSTHAIASNTKLTESRVEQLCAQHPKIKRNERERRTWTLDNQ